MHWSNVLVPRANLVAALVLTIGASAMSAQTAFVTCQNGEEVSRIDLTEMKETARWPLPGKPAGVAIGTAGDFYTVSPDDKTVRRLSTATGETLTQVTLDGGPIGIALDSRRNRVFVSDYYNARIWALDGTTLQQHTLLDAGAAPAGIAVSDDHRFVATADKDADQVSIFDADTLGLLHRVSVGERPFGLAFSPDGQLFVGNVGSNDISIVDAENGRVVATVPVGERPYGIAFAKGRAFVTNQYANSVSVILIETLEHQALIDVGEYPEGIDTTADGARVVVANWFDNTVAIIDPQSLDVLKTLETCDGPRAFGRFVGGETR